MYEDSWYSYVPEATTKPGPTNPVSPGHRRKESLLQQPNGTGQTAAVAEPLENVFEEIEDTNTPPEAAVMRRAASYSDFYHVAKAQLSKDASRKQKRRSIKKDRNWEALMLPVNKAAADRHVEDLNVAFDTYGDALLEASQQEYLLYTDQLALTERHLDGLIADANSTLKLLTSLSNSFQSVEAQTSTFQAQCEDLLTEQRRLELLADEVGTDLHYYAYLDTATRRLNAPGASHMVDADQFGEMVDSIDACIEFMESHANYRDRDSYLARYNALLVKALHLLDHGFTARLEKISPEISRQMAATKSESARHALAYGRFLEIILDTHSLLPNIQAVIRRVYDQFGRAMVPATLTSPTFAEAAFNLFQAYLTIRDRDLKPLTQQDLADYKNDSKTLSVETASRNFIKQTFEHLSSEENVFIKVFNMEPAWSTSADSAWQKLKTINTSMPHPANLQPLATSLQSVLQTAPLQAVCSVVGWLASEYSITESDEEDSPFYRKCREYTALLLAHHLWPFTDSAFEAEVTKSISKATLQDSSLQIGPVVGGVASSNAHPLVKRAVELLVMFDQAMPKERSSRNSPVVFKIVRETIQILQRAEARIKSIKSTDADLFMIKNLLIIKNELVSLEIGDIKSQTPSMQHFSQIWDTLSPQNWVNFFTSVVGSSLWPLGGTPSVTAKTLTVEDMNEQLDELLRQSIYAFTKRWATLINDSQARKVGVKPIAKVEVELENMLQTAFSNQPEVIMKLKEAIQLNAQAQIEAKDGEKGVRRY
ncbi:hypothetical protein S40288_01960 [Stachybotrys chartarum IBT 40288]|nr:hypothetical protein S40288_01960 [Stachybotrys chartarum IBT 40288]